MKNLRPCSKFDLTKSLKHCMWASFENSTWLAMFWRIFDISIRPRLMFGGGCFSTMPISNGETMAGLINLDNEH